jgi:gamma-tubulin complex component 5
VKRDVDGICEKLRFSNFHETEQKFKKLVEDCVTHELAVNHYEKDAIYSIINLLTTLAYDPIGNLKTLHLTGEDVIKFKPASLKVAKKASEVFISSLLKDNFKLQKNETDSELSEWTSSDEDDESDSEENSEIQVSPVKSGFASSLKPPEKFPVFKTITVENPEKWLQENIQHSWWTDEISSEVITSDHLAANFCTMWQKHLSNKSLGFIKPRPLSLVTEYCLLREILWMFTNPVDCKFFKLNDDEFVLRSDVTLPSTMPESLQIFLADFLRSINVMNRLKTDCLKSYQSATLCHTLETYFKIVQEILDRITSFILKEEGIVKAQDETYTIVILHKKLRPHAKILEIMWNIHTTSVLDDAKFPPHICASFLLASLSQHVQSSCNKEKKNLAIVLLMTCIRTYLEIFEIWWTEARLDDLKHEFLMEKIEDGDFEVIRPRLLVKSKEKSFYLNDDVSKTLTSDKVIDTMLSYSIKASFTLDIISKLDRVHEMRQIVNESASLHDEFVKKINDEIMKFAQHKEVKTETDAGQAEQNEKNKKLVDDLRNGMLANGDDLMLLAFQSTFDKLTAADTSTILESESLQLAVYDVLNRASYFILLPLEHSILRVLNELLQNKIAIAERFVMNIYFHEFQVEQHLQDIRKVFFVESNELINFFCLKLFPIIETGDSSWANPYLLTVALNDALCTTRQHSSTMFSVKVKRKFSYHSVFDAINEITINVNVNQNLMNIFPPKLIEKYNDGEY